MNNPKFIIKGRVIHAKTKQGMYNLKVEAWDKDEKHHDLVGVSQTDREGKFEMIFDFSYFKDSPRETAPDLFFRVFKARKLIKSTEDSVIWNAKRKTSIEIPVELDRDRPTGKDYVSSQKVLNTSAFIANSDFKGVFNQTSSKVKNTTRFVTDLVGNMATKAEVKPLKISGPNIDDVVGKNVDDVKTDFESRKITVNKVYDYKPGVDLKSVRDISSLPINLKANQKVNLYQENGKVRYYSIVKDEKRTPADVLKKMDLQEKEILNLKKEIEENRKTGIQKDEKIKLLQNELAVVKKGQIDVKKLIQDELKVVKKGQLDVTKLIQDEIKVMKKGQGDVRKLIEDEIKVVKKGQGDVTKLIRDEIKVMKKGQDDVTKLIQDDIKVVKKGQGDVRKLIEDEIKVVKKEQSDVKKLIQRIGRTGGTPTRPGRTGGTG